MTATALFFYKQKGVNCAQAIAKAWQQISGQKEELADQMSMCGHGKAPQGLCGALYAAQIISGKESAAKIASRFAEAADGSITCREIRSGKKLSCPECVKLAGTLLDESLEIASP
jgi:hypothetical protein